MSKTLLNTKQELIARLFYEEIALNAEVLVPDHPATARQLRAIILDILGYKQLPTGARVAKEREIKGHFGRNIYEDYEDEWAKDTNSLKNSIEAGSGKSTKSAAIWETLFSKDV